MNANYLTRAAIVVLLAASWLLAGCGATGVAAAARATPTDNAEPDYVIGPGDSLQVFVWGHDDLTTLVQVRPDGQISTPLVEDMQAAGKTPTILARDVEIILSEYVRAPTVTVIVQQFTGEYDRQIRVVGQATQPQALNYRAGMTLLDAMIEVGGLSEFASGNKAKIVRRVNGEDAEIRVKLEDLMNHGDMQQNVELLPGDVLVIPESLF